LLPKAARYLIAAAVTYTGAALALPALCRLWPAVRAPFLYYLLQVTVVKLLGDLVYFTVSPAHRFIAHLDDYLVNDFFTFYRLGVPLAVALAWFLATGRVPAVLTGVWLSPAAALALYLINRWLVEGAETKRRQRTARLPRV